MPDRRGNRADDHRDTEFTVKYILTKSTPDSSGPSIGPHLYTTRAWSGLHIDAIVLVGNRDAHPHLRYIPGVENARMFIRVCDLDFNMDAGGTLGR